MTDQRLDYINGLRAVAIIGVLWEHVIFFHHRVSGAFNFNVAVFGFRADLTFLAASGWLGVNLFFFLSGLVLMLPYARGDRQMTHTSDAVAYFKRRAARLLPLYYLGGAVAFCLFYRHSVGNSADWLAQWPSFLTATYIFTPEVFQPKFNWVFWSVGIEIWFSILFPVIVYAVRCVPIWSLLLLSIAVAVILRLYGHKIAGPQLIDGHTDSLIHRLPDFLFGMWAARIYASGTLSRYLRSYAAGAAGIMIMLVAMASMYAWAEGDLPLHVGAWMPSVLAAGFLLLTLFLLIRRPLTFGVLTVWPVQMIGMMCFSIYVWHGPLISGINLNTATEWASYWYAYLIALAAVCLASYRFVEFPGVSLRELFMLPVRSGLVDRNLDAASLGSAGGPSFVTR